MRIIIPTNFQAGSNNAFRSHAHLITNPPIILADEPTGSLDSQTEKEILELIQHLNQTENITFMIITHDEEVAQIAHRKLRMHDGQLLGDVQHVI